MVLGEHMLRECPESYIDDWTRTMITLFDYCHTISSSFGRPVIIPGPLPRSGGILDQDNATMEAFGVIRAEIMAMGEKK